MMRLDIHPEDLAAKVARGVTAHLRDPENLAGLSGAVLMPLIVFRGRRVPFIPLFLVSLMGEQAARLAYRSSEHLRVIAQAATGQIPEVSRTESCDRCQPGETVREHWAHGGRLDDIPDG